jgi:hypothetical protein
LLWDSRNKARTEAAAPAAAPSEDGQPYPTKALRKFLASLTARESPVLLDLGPVVGSNVNFFGERLGCKILLEDLFADFERHGKNPEVPFSQFLKGRLKHEAGSIDGILCWNFFDFLDLPSAQVLASSLTTLLRPEGAILAFFTTVGVPETRFSKYVIMDEDSLKQRPYSSGGKKQTALQNRDIIRMFDGLVVSDSFLLKNNTREMLLRKKT